MRIRQFQCPFCFYKKAQHRVQMFLEYILVHDYVIEVHKCVFPLGRGYCNVSCPLEGPSCIHEAERYWSKTLKPVMGDKGSLFHVFKSHWDLPVSRVAIKCRKYCHCSQRVKSFVHSRYLLGVPYRHVVQSSVVHTKSERCVGIFGRTLSAMPSLF